MLATYTFNSKYHHPTPYDMGLPNLRLLEGGTFEPAQHAAVLVNEHGDIRLRHFQWGLVSSWAGHTSLGKNRAFAAGRNIFQRPSFQEAIRYRRCLIPADGYHAKKDIIIGSPEYKISLLNDPMFCFAGVYEYWQNDRGEEVYSFAIITADTPRTLSQFGKQTPLMLSREQEKTWLDPETNLTQISAMLNPMSERMYKIEEITTDVELLPLQQKPAA